MPESEYIRIVNFEHCKTCTNWTTKDTEEPCYECLGVGAREGTEMPVNWKEREK